MTSSRQYDIILLGATGYTGLLTAEYLHQHLPAKYKWAIAGRNQAKLQKVNTTLTSLSSSRSPPNMLTTNLSASILPNFVKQARVLINCIGPYHLYSTPIVQACAETGTHYLDVTGETPWYYEILHKYESTAKKTGAILIPSCGFESTPSDVLAYTAAKQTQETYGHSALDVVGSIHSLKMPGLSGGTLATALGITEHYSLSYLRKTMGNPFILAGSSSTSSNPNPTTYHRSLLQLLTGVWSHPYLSLLTTSLTARPNVAIVHRTASLNHPLYSKNFTYEEYMRTSNTFAGIAMHFGIIISTLLLAIPPIRFLAKCLVTAPGAGPARATLYDGHVELRGVGATVVEGKQRKVLASVRFEGGGAYEWTAITLGQAAMLLLEDGAVDEVKARYGPGFLTPACLGERYVGRLERAGVKITAKEIG